MITCVRKECGEVALFRCVGEAIQVWVLYCQFAVDKMEVFEEGVEFVRGVFERAVTACGQHVTKVINWLGMP